MPDIKKDGKYTVESAVIKIVGTGGKVGGKSISVGEKAGIGTFGAVDFLVKYAGYYTERG